MRMVLSFVVALAAVSSCSALAGAAAEDLRAQCARVGNDDQTKPIPRRLVSQALRLFLSEAR